MALAWHLIAQVTAPSASLCVDKGTLCHYLYVHACHTPIGCHQPVPVRGRLVTGWRSVCGWSVHMCVDKGVKYPCLCVY